MKETVPDSLLHPISFLLKELPKLLAILRLLEECVEMDQMGGPGAERLRGVCDVACSIDSIHHCCFVRGPWPV